MYILERVPELVKARPELAQEEPYARVLCGLAGNRQSFENLKVADLEKLAAARLTGVPLDTFNMEVARWLATATCPSWKRLYTELTYQPIQELLKLLRASSYRTYIATGDGQDFVRIYAKDVYGISPEQVIGTTSSTRYGDTGNGEPLPTKEP